jgi:hypothetical protein
MSKNRTFGENVRVRLFAEDGITPLVIDFDTITLEQLNKNKTNRAIGKKKSGHQTYNDDGWKIVLTRSKRDNYIQSLIHYHEMALEKGLNPPKYTVQHITTHTYNVTNVNPYLEFTGDNLGSFKLPFNTGGTNIANIGLNALNSVANSAINLTAIPTIAKNLQPFREMYIYKHCSLSIPSFSDRPKEYNDESITLHCSSRVSESDLNLFDDSYMNDNARSSVLNKIKELNNSIFDFGQPQLSDIQEGVEISVLELYNKLIEGIGR